MTEENKDIGKNPNGEDREPQENPPGKTPGGGGERPKTAPEKPAEKPAKPAKKEKEPEGPPPPSLVLSSSPHIRTENSIENAMYMVILALLPATIGAMVFFGVKEVLLVTGWCVVGCVVFEGLCLRMTGTKNWGRTALDGSAILTGLLLAMNLPSNAPWWLCLAGAFVAMVIAKHVFGGLGANPFNPALVARVFLLIAWPARMTSWPIPRYASDELIANANPDGLTAATPLGVLGVDGLEKMKEQFPLSDVFVGNVGGCLGETSAILLLIGGVFLIWKGVIRWHIPVSFIATVFALSALAWAVKPGSMATPFFHVFAGGLFLGAIFMATDYVTSPLSGKGMIVFGVFCGVLTFVIRQFGSFPEGVSFSIVIMNSMVPLVDRYCVPKRFGLQSQTAES